MKQREIWQADLNPIKGSEQSGIRPVVIISGDLLNKYLNVVITCPLTSQIKKYKGNPILEPDNTNGLRRTSEVLTFQIRSMSKERLVKKIGTIGNRDLEMIHSTLEDIMKY